MNIATQAQTQAPAQGTQEGTPRFAGLRAAISTMFEFLAIVVIPALFFASLVIAFQVLIPGASSFMIWKFPAGQVLSVLSSGVMTVCIEAAMVGCSSLSAQAKAMENDRLASKYQNFGLLFFVLFLATISFKIFPWLEQYSQYLELIRCACAGLYAYLCHGDKFDPDQPTASTQRMIEVLEEKLQSQDARLIEERKQREQEKREHEALIDQKVEALLQKKLPEMRVQIQNNLMVPQPQYVSVREEHSSVPQLPSGSDVWNSQNHYQPFDREGRVLVTQPNGTKFVIEADGSRKDPIHEIGNDIQGLIAQFRAKNSSGKEAAIPAQISPEKEPEIEAEFPRENATGITGQITGGITPSNSQEKEPEFTQGNTPRNSMPIPPKKEILLDGDWDAAIEKFPQVIEWRSSGLKSLTIEQIMEVTGYSKQKISRAKLASVKGGNKKIFAVVNWLKKEPKFQPKLPQELEPEFDAQITGENTPEIEPELEAELPGEIEGEIEPQLEEEIAQEIQTNLPDTGEHIAISDEALYAEVQALEDLYSYQPVPACK